MVIWKKSRFWYVVPIKIWQPCAELHKSLQAVNMAHALANGTKEAPDKSDQFNRYIR
jgi:hypothetical protein